jgi:aldose 1-epimerase
LTLSQLFQSSGSLDHCFVVQNPSKSVQPLAVLTAPDRQLSLTVLSDLPGVQVYSGDGLAAPFKPRQGICLEAQFWPDAPNQPDFPSTLLRAGESYQQQIIYRFARRQAPDSND